MLMYADAQPLAAFGLLVLSPLCFNPHLELFIVVVLLPLILNAFQVTTSPCPPSSSSSFVSFGRVLKKKTPVSASDEQTFALSKRLLITDVC